MPTIRSVNDKYLSQPAPANTALRFQEVEYMAFDDEEPRGVNEATPQKLQIAAGHFDIQELMDQGFTVQARLYGTLQAQPGETVTIEVHGEVDNVSVGVVNGPEGNLRLQTANTAQDSLSTPWVTIGSFYTGTMVPAGASFWEHDVYGYRTPAGSTTPAPIFVHGATVQVRAVRLDVTNPGGGGGPN